MKQYLSVLSEIFHKGNSRGDRTGTGTCSLFGRQMIFDLADGFPLPTTKKMFTRGMIEELLWIIKGSTDNKVLTDMNVHIWDKWATDNGSLGPIYGKQWRDWEETKIISFDDIEKYLEMGYKYFDEFYNPESEATLVIVKRSVDQLSELIKGLKEKPYSRRHIVSAWNPSDLPDESISPQANVKNGKMSLAPCHTMFQMYVTELTISDRFNYAMKEFREYNRHGYTVNDPEAVDWMNDLGIPKNKLSCQLYQRSADFPLGVPFNTASYALLTMMIAQCVNMIPGEFIHTFGDAHIYSDQMDGVGTQLTREPFPLPTMKLNPKVTNIFDFKIEDFTLENYLHHTAINYPVSV